VQHIKERLIDKGIRVISHDPLAKENLMNHFGDKIRHLDKLDKNIFNKPMICVLTLQSQEYKTLLEKHKFDKETVIIDCWRALDPSKLKGKVKHVPLGKFKPTNAQKNKKLQ
jgi:UDP-glucose 6-dehydrogenase